MGPWWILSYQGSLPLVSPTLHILAWVSEQELLQCLLNSLQTPLALRLLAQKPLLPLVHIFPWGIKWMKSLINKISPEDRLQLSKWGTELSFRSRDEHQCFCPSYSGTYSWRGSVAKPCSHVPPATSARWTKERAKAQRVPRATLCTLILPPRSLVSQWPISHEGTLTITLVFLTHAWPYDMTAGHCGTHGRGWRLSKSRHAHV